MPTQQAAYKLLVRFVQEKKAASGKEMYEFRARKPRITENWRRKVKVAEELEKVAEPSNLKTLIAETSDAKTPDAQKLDAEASDAAEKEPKLYEAIHQDWLMVASQAQQLLVSLRNELERLRAEHGSSADPAARAAALLSKVGRYFRARKERAKLVVRSSSESSLLTQRRNLAADEIWLDRWNDELDAIKSW